MPGQVPEKTSSTQEERARHVTGAEAGEHPTLETGTSSWTTREKAYPQNTLLKVLLPPQLIRTETSGQREVKRSDREQCVVHLVTCVGKC